MGGGEPQGESEKATAQEHFRRGLEHLGSKRWEAALAEFLRSREVFPTRSATQNAAVVYKELNRPADALEMFESLLTEFPDLPNRDAILKEIAGLESKVGTIAIADAPPGALVVIDGRTHEQTPLSRPIRVNAGVHVVRVVKEGAEPWEVETHVAGGQAVRLEAKLQVLARAGTLEVVESTGTPARVWIDGVDVGAAPYRGLLPIGSRIVLLVGDGNLGTQPVSVPIKLGETTALRLALEPLRCGIRVSPTPAGALVSIDGVDVTRGSWEGSLRCGKHVVEAANEGFLPVKREVVLDEGLQEFLALSLQRDPSSPLWAERRPPRLFVEAAMSLLFAPTLGGDGSNCEGDCETGRTWGGHPNIRAGYQFGAGLGFAAEAGYLWLGASSTRRALQLETVPAGSPLEGTVSEDLRLRALTLGAVVSYQQGETWPWLVGLGAGVALGSMLVEREGKTTDSGTALALPSLSESLDARYAYVAPEARIGYRVLDRLELGIGLRPIVLVALKQPEWASGKELPAGSLGLVDYPQETLAGRLLVAFSGNVGLRMNFF